jgi:hypothetical protein
MSTNVTPWVVTGRAMGLGQHGFEKHIRIFVRKRPQSIVDRSLRLAPLPLALHNGTSDSDDKAEAHKTK